MSDINLRFITGVRWYKGQLEMLNHLTYIYDSQWNPNNSVKSTLPVSFFHVKSCREVMASEISQKQMLFYNSSADPSKADAKLDSGLLNVVADNIVIKPKMYKLDVVVPYHRLSLLDQSFVYNTHTMNAMQEAIIKTRAEAVNNYIGSWATLKQPYVDLVTNLIRTLVASAVSSESGSEIDTFLKSVTNENDYNKESLEAMWRMRHIVRMKMWNSWQYKYVAISDIEITKEGNEDGVYEATLTLQEMPIVSMGNIDTVSIKSWAGKVMNAKRNALLQVRGQAVIDLLDNASNVFGQSN